MVRNEFKPPSDFVNEESGGGGKKVWKWVGIGCGVIVLIVGIFLALGTWKTVSCCSDAVDVAQSTNQARQFGLEFAGRLSQGKVDKAWSQTSAKFQSETSREQFEEKVAAHAELLGASQPRMANLNVQHQGSQKPTRWEMSVEFAQPTGDQKLVLITEAVRQGEGDSASFHIDSLRFDVRHRSLSDEPPAREVIAFHGDLRGGSYEAAYKRLAPSFAKERDTQSFRDFIGQQEALFTAQPVNVGAVEYLSGRQARVVVQVNPEQGQPGVIEYRLRQMMPGMPNWKINSIAPTYESAPKAAEPAEEADASGPDAGAEGVDGGGDAGGQTGE